VIYLRALKYIALKSYIVFAGLIVITVLGYLCFVRYPLIKSAEDSTAEIEIKKSDIQDKDEHINRLNEMLAEKEDILRETENLLNEYPQRLNVQICMYKIISIAESNGISLQQIETLEKDFPFVTEESLGSETESLNAIVDFPTIAFNLNISGSEFDSITAFISDLMSLEWPGYITAFNSKENGADGFFCEMEVTFLSIPVISYSE
jgi:hypothetical protein